MLLPPSCSWVIGNGVWSALEMSVRSYQTTRFTYQDTGIFTVQILCWKIQTQIRIQITNLMQQFSSLLSWPLFTAQHVSGVFRPARPRTTVRLSPRYEGKPRGCHCSHWAPDDGRENARNMLSCKHRQDNKLKNCCIRLVIYLNCTMMHGLTNLKFYI